MLYFLLLFSLICNFNASEVAIALQKFIQLFWEDTFRVSKCRSVMVSKYITKYVVLNF